MPVGLVFPLAACSMPGRGRKRQRPSFAMNSCRQGACGPATCYAKHVWLEILDIQDDDLADRPKGSTEVKEHVMARIIDFYFPARYSPNSSRLKIVAK